MQAHCDLHMHELRQHSVQRQANSKAQDWCCKLYSITIDEASNVTICTSVLSTAPVLGFAGGLPPHVVSMHVLHM